MPSRPKKRAEGRAKLRDALEHLVASTKDLAEEVVGPDGSEEDYVTLIVRLACGTLGILLATLAADEAHLQEGIEMAQGMVGDGAKSVFAGIHELPSALN